MPTLLQNRAHLVRSLYAFKTLRSCGLTLGALAASLLLFSAARAQNCPVTHADLTQALKRSVKPSGGPSNGGFDNNEWAVVVNRDGMVCAVTMRGRTATDQWLASRAIAAEKATTANAVSLKQMAISTANLYAASASGGPLYGLITTNPPVPSLLYAGEPNTYGTAQDPFLGQHIGGVVVFGGGLALYEGGNVVGAVGVSGDTSCADHNVAWRVREALRMAHVPNGVSPAHDDAILYDLLPTKVSVSGWGHPQCGGHETEVAEQIHSGYVPEWNKAVQQ
jgi:uncharacterized protein GlcG (DUF336 family)